MTTFIQLPLTGSAGDEVLQAADTNSIDHTTSGGILTSDLRLSGTAAGAGFLKLTTSIDSGGLLVLVPEADGSTTGVLTSTDWNTFNDGVTPDTSGSLPGAGEIGELISSEQAITSTGVGATGVYGSATSVTLTAGIWIVEGLLAFNDNGAVITSLVAGIGQSATGLALDEFNTIKIETAATESSVERRYVMFPVYTAPGFSQTYYLNTQFTYSSGTPQHGGRLQARRVR